LEWGIWRGMQNVGLEGKFGGVCKMQTRLEAMLELSFLHQTSKFRSRGPYRGLAGVALNVSNTTLGTTWAFLRVSATIAVGGSRPPWLD
jgi:hypothetical protein